MQARPEMALMSCRLEFESHVLTCENLTQGENTIDGVKLRSLFYCFDPERVFLHGFTIQMQVDSPIES